jgi:hypothetical protein
MEMELTVAATHFDVLRELKQALQMPIHMARQS